MYKSADPRWPNWKSRLVAFHNSDTPWSFRMSPKAAGSRADRWIRRFSEKWPIAIVIAAASVITAMLTFGGTLVNQGSAILQRTGLVASEEVRRVRRSAYRLGKAVGTVTVQNTLLESDKNPSLDSLPVDIQGSINSERATLDAILKQLSLPADPSKLDFVDRFVKTYKSSPASRAINDLLIAKYGSDPAEAYDAGIEISSANWLAIQHRFEDHMIPDGEFWPARGTLAGLNEHAHKLGAKTV